MSDLTDRIAEDHHTLTTQDGLQCSCGHPALGDRYLHLTKHLMEVAEAAVREQVARDIEARADAQPKMRVYRGEVPGPTESGMRDAARIARGGCVVIPHTAEDTCEVCGRILDCCGNCPKCGGRE